MVSVESRRRHKSRTSWRPPYLRRSIVSLHNCNVNEKSIHFSPIYQCTLLLFSWSLSGTTRNFPFNVYYLVFSLSKVFFPCFEFLFFLLLFISTKLYMISRKVHQKRRCVVNSVLSYREKESIFLFDLILLG